MKKTILLFNPRPDPNLKELYIPLALLCISRLLDRKGYHIKIVSGSLFNKPFEVLKDYAKTSYIFGVSSMTGYQIIGGLRASELVKKINKNIKIVWGGWHASVYPKQTLMNRYIDIVVKGPGERAFLAIVKRIEENKDLSGIPGVYWKNEGKIMVNTKRRLD